MTLSKKDLIGAELGDLALHRLPFPECRPRLHDPLLMLDHATYADVLFDEQITRVILKACLRPITSVSMAPSNRAGSGGLVGLRQLGIFRLRRARRGI
jgi:hypothetical protein